MLAAQLHGAVPSAHPARITLLSAITFDASVQRCVCVCHSRAGVIPGLFSPQGSVASAADSHHMISPEGIRVYKILVGV